MKALKVDKATQSWTKCASLKKEELENEGFASDVQRRAVCKWI